MREQFALQAREDFRDAAVRHQRSAWRVTAVCALAYVLLGILVAVGLSPLFWGIIGITFDIVNLIVPTPNVFRYASQQLDPIALAHASIAHCFGLVGLVALPGILVLIIAAQALRRALMHSPLFEMSPPVGRPALVDNLAEIQLVHTVEEMAIAGNIRAPRVLFIDESVNGAAFGTDTHQATVVIGAQMVKVLTRPQMQAVAAHFVASIADGDLSIGLRTACVVGVFSLVQRLGMDVLTSIDNRDAFRATLRLLRALFVPGAASTELILRELSDPFASSARTSAHGRGIDRRMTWREWVLMPALGPVFFNGLIGGIINSMALSPLVNLTWRERKYIADATAVRLTRDPDALDSALAAIGSAGASVPMPQWASHLCIVEPRSAGGGHFPVSRISIVPPPGDRHAALMRMGSSDRAVPSGYHESSWPVKLAKALMSLLFVVLMMFAVGAVGCAYCLSLIATLFPIGILHVILR